MSSSVPPITLPTHAARRGTPTPAALRAPWWAAAAGLGVGGVCALIAFAPAHWLAQSVHQASQGHLQLRAPQGTLWNGSAQLVLTGGANSQDQAALPGRWQWKTSWNASALQLTVHSDCCLKEGVHASLRLGWMQMQIRVSDHHSQWPAAVLAGLGTPWNTVQPQGVLQWETEGLQMHWQAGRWQMQGKTALQLQQFASRLSTLSPMGSYRLELQGRAAGAAPSLHLRTLDGPLQLHGDGELTGGRLRFRGEARAEEPHTAALSNLLNLLGRRQGNRSHISLG